MYNVHHDVLVVEPEIVSTSKKLSPAGAWLVRRHRVPHDIADFVAQCAGLSADSSMDREEA